MSSASVDQLFDYLVKSGRKIQGTSEEAKLRMVTEREYMDDFLKLLYQKYGNAEGYIKKLGFNALDIARIRAVEFGLPVIRVANTGISAVIDPYGRILAQLPLSSSGLIDSYLPMDLPKTPYARFGDFIFGGMIVVLLCLSFASFYESKFKNPSAPL